MSEIANKCTKETERPVVKPWKGMINGNISMRSLLDFSRGNVSAEDYDNAKQGTDQETANITSTLAHSLRFEGDYLTTNGVQMAISETFKQLKEHQTNEGHLQETDQVILNICILMCDLQAIIK